MTSFTDLSGAFNSLMDTLQNRFTPFLSEDISRRWLGTLALAAAIARDTDAWNALPDDLPDAEADALVAALDAAARAVAASGRSDDATVLAALDMADRALDQLRSFLASRGGG